MADCTDNPLREFKRILLAGFNFLSRDIKPVPPPQRPLKGSQ